MADVGLALMLEQVGPAQALDLVRAADAAGFRGLMSADTLQPWIPAGPDQARAPHLWSVLSAAAGQARGPLGAVITPNFRHHPLTIAQASATLASLHPGRHWLGLAAGEAINDAVTGRTWRRAPERINAMFEAADLIGRLFTNSANGRDTKYAGEHARVESARLWTMPEHPPRILIATAGPTTARRAGRHTDGFITMGTGLDKARLLLERFAQGAHEGGRRLEESLKVVRLHVSWAPTIERATSAALTHWPQAAMRFHTGDIRSPFDFAQIAKLVRPEDFAGNVLITTEPGEIADLARAYREIGFDEVYLHNIGGAADGWFEIAREQVLPPLTLA